MRYAFQSVLLVCTLVIAGDTTSAHSKRADEPPLVGTVVFSTPGKRDKLDINTASKRQISALPGLAPYTDKIIAERPYTTKLDLVKRGIVPQVVYDKVKDRIIAHRVRGATRSSATR